MTSILEKYYLMRLNSLKLINYWGGVYRTISDYQTWANQNSNINLVDLFAQWSSEVYDCRGVNVRLIYMDESSSLVYKAQELSSKGKGTKTVKKEKKQRQKKQKADQGDGGIKRIKDKAIGLSGLRHFIKILNQGINFPVYNVLVHASPFTPSLKEEIFDYVQKTISIEKLYVLPDETIMTSFIDRIFQTEQDKATLLAELGGSKDFSTKKIPSLITALHIYNKTDPVVDLETLSNYQRIYQIRREETIPGTLPSINYRYVDGLSVPTIPEGFREQ